MPAPRATPSREEVMEYIRQVAAQYGIDPETFLRIVEGESDFDPAARGDFSKKTGQPQSVGLTQLFERGLAPDFTEKTGGLDPADPHNWRQTIDHMAQSATETQGKRGGWEPWHAAKRAGIAQYEGLPQGQATGRRGRAGEIAQMPGPMVPPMFVQPVGSVKEKRSDRVPAERQPKTLGGAVARGVLGEDQWGSLDEDATAGSLVSMFTNRQKTGVDKEAAGVAALAKGTSPYAITGDVASQVQRQKKTNKMATLADYFYNPTKPEEDPLKKKTLAGGLLNMFGFG